MLKNCVSNSKMIRDWQAAPDSRCNGVTEMKGGDKTRGEKEKDVGTMLTVSSVGHLQLRYLLNVRHDGKMYFISQPWKVTECQDFGNL